jgi:hypothetical protein
LEKKLITKNALKCLTCVNGIDDDESIYCKINKNINNKLCKEYSINKNKKKGEINE